MCRRINEDIHVIVLMLRFCAAVGKESDTEVRADLGKEADVLGVDRPDEGSDTRGKYTAGKCTHD